MGGKSSTSTSSVQIPPQVLAQYSNVTNQANQLMGINPSTGQPNTPFQIYSTNPNAFVAPLTAEQNAGIAATNQYANTAQPFYGAAGALTLAGAGPANLGSLNTNQYMSPYMGDVVNSMLAAQNMQNAQQASQLQGQAVAAGAYGGDRSSVAQANLAYQQNLANQQSLAGALQSGYTQAQNTAAQQQAAQLAAEQANLARLSGAGAQLGNLGTAAQTAGLQGAQAMQAAGLTQQQTQQAGLQALYNQFQQQQAYPFQLLGELANISEGIGALSGSTTTTTQPSSFFSDERLKEDIQPIGETYDGQKIVKFRYKGHPGKQIGLIAQDVEKHHPDAVGLAGGYKTVDYDRATKAAADRGHYYSGGLVPSSEGGAVGIGHYGEGFADGGSPIAMPSYDPNYLMQMIAAQKQMFGSAPGGGLYGSSGMGGVHPGVGGPASGFSPLPVSGLKVAQPPAQQQPTMSDVAGTINSWAQAGSNLDKGFSSLSKGIDKLNAAYQGSDLQNLIDPTGYQSNIAQQNVASGAAGLASGGVASYAAGGSTITPYHDAAMYSPQTLGAPDVVARASGGLVPRGHFDVGGTPYDPNQDASGGYMKLGEASQPNPPKQLATAQAPGQSGQSGLGNLSSLMGIGASAATLAPKIASGIGAAADAIGTQAAIASGLAEAASMVPTGMTAADALAAGLIALARGGYVHPPYHDDKPTHNRGLGAAMDAYHRASGGRTGYDDGGETGDGANDGTLTPEQLQKITSDVNTPTPPDPASVDAVTGQPIQPGDLGHVTNAPVGAGLKRAWDSLFGSSDSKPNDYIPAGTPGAEMPLYNYTPPNTPHWNPGSMTEIGEIPSNDSVANATVSPASAAAAAAAGPDGTRQTTTGTFANTPAGLSPHAVPVKPAQPAPSATPPAAGAQTGLAGGATSATPAVPAAAAGVAGAPAAAAGVTPPAKGDWMSRNQDWLVPLLSGIGAMASSPSRYLGAALLQGVGAGAGAYENVQNQMQQRAEAAATTGATQVGAAHQAFQFIPGLGYAALTIDPKTGNVIPMPMDQYEAMRQQGHAPQLVGQPSVAGNVIPSQVSITPPITVPGTNYDDNARSAAKADSNSVLRSTIPGAADAILATSKKTYDDITNNSESARTSRSPTIQLMSALSVDPQSGLLDAPGWGASGRAQLVNLLNTAANTFGVPVSFGDITNDTITANKINTLRAGMAAHGADQRSLGALEAYLNASPNKNMPAETAADLTAQLMIGQQRQIDRANFASLYAKDSGGVYGPNFNSSFDSSHSTAQYQADAEALKNLMLNPVGRAVIQRYNEGRVSPAQMESFLVEHGAPVGIGRYFGYGR